MTEIAKARLKDDQTINALEQLEAEHGSKAAAIRHALKTAVEDHDDDSDEIDPKLKQAHRCLWTNCVGRRMTMETAKSVLAQELQINQHAVKSSMIPKLESEGLVNVVQANWSVAVEVSPPDPEEIDDEPAIKQPNRDLSDAEQTAHHAVWSESDEYSRISIDDAIDSISDEIETFEYNSGRIVMQLAEADAVTVDLKNSQICVRDPNPDSDEATNDEIETDTDEQLAELETAEPVRADGGQP